MQQPPVQPAASQQIAQQQEPFSKLPPQKRTPPPLQESFRPVELPPAELVQKPELQVPHQGEAAKDAGIKRSAETRLEGVQEVDASKKNNPQVPSSEQHESSVFDSIKYSFELGNPSTSSADLYGAKDPKEKPAAPGEVWRAQDTQAGVGQSPVIHESFVPPSPAQPAYETQPVQEPKLHSHEPQPYSHEPQPTNVHETPSYADGLAYPPDYHHAPANAEHSEPVTEWPQWSDQQPAETGDRLLPSPGVMAVSSQATQENQDYYQHAVPDHAPIADGPQCPNCNVHLEANARFCGECGYHLGTRIPSCPLCSAPLELDAKFCGECGSKLVPAVYSQHLGPGTLSMPGRPGAPTQHGWLVKFLKMLEK
jgi:hypothetical protein